MKTLILSFFFFFHLHTIFANPCFTTPWGKDSDLCQKAKRETSSQSSMCETLFFGGISEGLIRFHQKILSPADGPRSHYIPSSSQYMLNAMRKYGFFYGYALGCDRLMRENSEPWVYRTTLTRDGDLLKLDPVR